MNVVPHPSMVREMLGANVLCGTFVTFRQREWMHPILGLRLRPSRMTDRLAEPIDSTGHAREKRSRDHAISVPIAL